MRRGRTLIFVLLIVVIGLAVAFVALRPILFPAPEVAAPVSVEIYVVLQPIPQGGEITDVGIKGDTDVPTRQLDIDGGFRLENVEVPRDSQIELELRIKNQSNGGFKFQMQQI